MAHSQIVYGGFLGILPNQNDINLNFNIKGAQYGGPTTGTFKAADFEFARANIVGLNLTVDPTNSEWDKYSIISGPTGSKINADGYGATDTVGSASMVASRPGDLDGLQTDLPNPLPFINNNDWKHDNFEYTFNYGSTAWQNLAVGQSITVTYTVKAWEYDYPLPGITEVDDIKITMTFTKTCFDAATMILMADGSEKPAGEIVVGDLVATADHGAQPVRWVGRNTITPAELAHFPSWRPVRIAAGALGNGLPAADLTVSQLHRVIVRGDVAREAFGTDELLIPAQFLTALDGIDLVEASAGADLVHFMFDNHEIVTSNGARSESFCVSPLSRSQIGAQQLAELETLFPELAEKARNGRHDLARPVARAAMAESVVAQLRARALPLQ